MKPTASGDASVALPAYLQVVPGGIELLLKVQPRAKRNEIGEVLGNEHKVKITAPPVDSAANQALMEFLAETLGVPRGAVRLVRGQTSRHKVVFVADLSLNRAIRLTVALPAK